MTCNEDDVCLYGIFPLSPLHNVCEWIAMSWIDAQCEVRHDLVNTDKSPNDGRHLYLHSWQRYGERRGVACCNLWAVVWSLAFSYSLYRREVLPLCLSQLLWRRLPQRFRLYRLQHYLCGAVCMLTWRPNPATRVTWHIVLAVPAR